LGLGNWEPRIPGVDPEELDDVHRERLSQRAYSISCSILNADGKLVRPSDYPYLEFYVSLVRHSDRRPPALTPRLFAIESGARIHVGDRATGHYTLAGVPPEADLFFIATGTGEAPHNTMIAELLARGHAGRIVSAVGIRYAKDAAYRQIHEELTRMYPNYRYLVLTTREPENLDRAHPGFIGKRYLQAVAESGDLERESGVPLDPDRAHVFLCGNPEMIGLRQAGGERETSAAPGGMLEVMMRHGFRPDDRHSPGNLHFERYW
jgi:ferredoxin--NADP+ reductase